MNLIFMGTGPFALTALQRLYEKRESGDVLSVFTKPDKPSGRGMKIKKACVAAFAEENGLPLYQPKTLREEESGALFRSLHADMVIVASYGLLLPSYVLHEPKWGCLNIHASLLPRYRGAAPINRCIMEDEKESGVTIMQMDEVLDTGDMLLQKSIPILPDEDAGSLFERLAELGAEMIIQAIPMVKAGTLSPIKQDETKSTYAAKISSEDQELNWDLPSRALLCRIRGLSPTPCAFTRTRKDGKILKIHRAYAVEGAYEGEVGQIVATKPDVLVKTADGVIALDLVQPEGKPKMRAQDLVNGRKLLFGEMLGL